MRQTICAAVLGVCLIMTPAGGAAATLRTLPEPILAPLENLLPAGQIMANDNILATIPRCDNLKVMREPAPFTWTNFSKRARELSKAEWGYFTCPQPAASVSDFYRARMNKPPYNQGETNWIVRRNEGTLGVYYSYASGQWLYLWIVPKPGDAKASYVVVARSTGVAINCRFDRRRELAPPPQSVSASDEKAPLQHQRLAWAIRKSHAADLNARRARGWGAAASAGSRAGDMT